MGAKSTKSLAVIGGAFRSNVAMIRGLVYQNTHAIFAFFAILILLEVRLQFFLVCAIKIAQELTQIPVH